MKNKTCDFCPGCKRRCPSCCPRCKYGKKYFNEKPANDTRPEWARVLTSDGPAWQLLRVSKKVKKAIRRDMVTEDALFSSFSPQDMRLFRDLLGKLEQNPANSV